MDQDKPLEKAEKVEAPEAITFAEFLESYPPSQMVVVQDALEAQGGGGNVYYRLTTPRLMLHCSNAECNGLRWHRFTGESGPIIGRKDGDDKSDYLRYICSNCRTNIKLFSVYCEIAEGLGRCYKYGELPVFGPHTPSRLIRLFGADSDVFLKGRRCESQGLGIGAFVYYRRVVENHKNQILDEIIRVSEKLAAPPAAIELLRAAKEENQFSKALASVKDALPQALLVNGQNPLTLLHAALSGGLHNQSDEECLGLAQAVRVVLVELAERLGQALKDERELLDAVARLTKPRKKKDALSGVDGEGAVNG